MAAFFERLVALFTVFLISLSTLFPTIFAQRINNVILLIGDGMGVNHIQMTEEIRDIDLSINNIENYGFSQTYSANNPVTDSAAGATALSCGVKTSNGAIGMYPKDANGNFYTLSYPKSITEFLHEKGFKTGIITTDSVLGATPSAFSAHVKSRNDAEEIAQCQLNSCIDFIWGKYDETVTKEQVTSAGYTYISTVDEMNGLSADQKSYGMFTSSLYHTYNKNDYTPTLSQMTNKAISMLDESGERFFIMIEGAHIDKKSHDHDIEGAAEALEEFDNAVEIALEYAKKDKHTLVVVTADHETGGLILNENNEYEMTAPDHTAADVPVFAYGPVNILKNGETIENTDIPKKITEALKYKDFPQNVTLTP